MDSTSYADLQSDWSLSICDALRVATEAIWEEM